MSRIFPSQGLCTFCFLCLVYSSPVSHIACHLIHILYQSFFFLIFYQCRQDYINFFPSTFASYSPSLLYFSSRRFIISHTVLFAGLVAKPYPTLVTLWTIACQALLSMGFSRQEYWSGLPFPSPGDLPDPVIEPRSPALQADSLPTELQWKPTLLFTYLLFVFFHLCVSSLNVVLITAIALRCAQLLQLFRFFVTPWTIAHQAPLSMGFSRQEYLSGLPCPLQGIFPALGLYPHDLHLLGCRQILYLLSRLGSPLTAITQKVNQGSAHKTCFPWVGWMVIFLIIFKANSYCVLIMC